MTAFFYIFCKLKYVLLAYNGSPLLVLLDNYLHTIYSLIHLYIYKLIKYLSCKLHEYIVYIKHFNTVLPKILRSKDITLPMHAT